MTCVLLSKFKSFVSTNYWLAASLECWNPSGVTADWPPTSNIRLFHILSSHRVSAEASRPDILCLTAAWKLLVGPDINIDHFPVRFQTSPSMWIHLSWDILQTDWPWPGLTSETRHSKVSIIPGYRQDPSLFFFCGSYF